MLQEIKEPLAATQYGFSKGKSTTDAVKQVLIFGAKAKEQKQYAIITALDIQNAYNTVPWFGIDEALKKKGTPDYLRRVIQSYLSNRTLMVGDRKMRITAEVPQGSVLGPLLWCLYYDQVLRIDIGQEVEFLCYADDIAILTRANTRVKLLARTENSVGIVMDRLKDMGLTVAAAKTEAVMISSKRDPQKMKLTLGGEDVYTVDSMKCLMSFPGI